MLDNTNNEGDSGGDQKDLENPIFEVFEDKFKKCSDLRGSLVVLAIPNDLN
jgi:hypothetical protein